MAPRIYLNPPDNWRIPNIRDIKHIKPISRTPHIDPISRMVYLFLLATILLLLHGCSTMTTDYNDHDTHIRMTRSVPPVFGEKADVAVTFEQDKDGAQKIGFIVKNKTDGTSWIQLTGAAIAGAVTAWFSGGVAP